MRDLDACARSRPAPGSEANEDAVHVDIAGGVFVVADGMGGRPGGEVASQRALTVFVEELARFGEGMPSDAVLQTGVVRANDTVREIAGADASLTGMGSTLSALVLREDRAKVVHVGDSKVFLCRDGTLEQLTLDFTAEAEFRRADPDADVVLHPRFSNMLTRAVGIEEAVEPQIRAVELQEGDRFLLASDGLTKVLEPSEILSVVAEAPCSSAAALCGKLLGLAEAREPEDDVTVGVVVVGKLGG